MKMQYDVEKKKIIMSQNDAKELKIFVKGYNAAAMKTLFTAQVKKELLASDLLLYTSDVPAEITVNDFLKMVKAAAKEWGVDLEKL